MDEARVFVIDDDFFARSDLRNRLARHSRIRVVGEAGGPGEALELLRDGACEAPPHVVVLDLAYEDPSFCPASFLQELRALLPTARVLGISVRKDDALALDAYRASVDGVLWKEEVGQRICRAVLRIHEGARLVTPGVARALLGQVSRLPEVFASEGHVLTPRLEQVARLWCEAGMSAHEIAEELHLAEQTVRGYIKEIYQVLGVAESGSQRNRRQRAYEAHADGPEMDGDAIV